MPELFHIEPHVRSMIDEDGAVLLDLKAGKYYSLNSVAANVWTRVEQGLEATEVYQQLGELFNVDRDRLEADVAAMVEGLEKQGLVRANA